MADQAAAVKRIDDIVRAYADVVRARPGDETAAWNLEFVARVRASSRRAASRPSPSPKPAAWPAICRSGRRCTARRASRRRGRRHEAVQGGGADAARRAQAAAAGRQRGRTAQAAGLMLQTLPTVDWQALEFRQPDYLWLLVGPARCWSCGCGSSPGGAPTSAATCATAPCRCASGSRPSAGCSSGCAWWRPTTCVVLALARPAVGDDARAAGRHRPGGAAGRLDVDAGHRHDRQPLEPLDAVPAHAGRDDALGRRSHCDDVVRAHRHAAGAADQGPEHVLLLHRSPHRAAVPLRRRRLVGHQHRDGHRLGR